MGNTYYRLMRLLFPPKCILCNKPLPPDQTDLCHLCRKEAPLMEKTRARIPFTAKWTALWQYKGPVRDSILRFKFHRRRHYAAPFGRFLAVKLQSAGLDQVDIITWVPVSPLRKWYRGYDQARLIAEAVARELGTKAERCLVKRRNNKPQSMFKQAAQRRANVEGVFRVENPGRVAGKRILVIDDIITTGSTMSECAKQLQFAGCQEVYGAALAATPRKKKQEESA